MVKRADDFPENVRKTVAARAGHRCSFPFCGQTTSGPAQQHAEKSINSGCAAHITAASPGGARYDETMSSEERKDITNAIWMCRHHGDLIDKENNHYTPEQLKAWKVVAETKAYKELEKSANSPEFTSRDIRALEETCKIFTYEAATRLRNEVFGATVERIVMDPVNWYWEEGENPKYRFNHPRLQELAAQLMKQCADLSCHFARHCGGGIGDRYSYINVSRVRLYTPQYEDEMKEYVYKTQDLARSLSDTVLEILNIKEDAA